MSNENFIREIDEELRSDQMRSLWRNFGPWIIAAAVLLVVGVAGWEAWQWWSNSNSARSSDQFYSALTLADGTDVAAAQQALAEVEAQGVGSYPVLARFREGALLAKEGKTTEATAAYDAIATGESNQHLRGLALVLAGYTLVDAGDVGPVEQRVGGLAVPGNPMRNAAREALGLVKYKAGDLNGALADFEAVLADPMVSRETQSRLEIYEAQLKALGAAAPATATDGGAVTDTTKPAAETAPAAEAPAAPAMEAAPAAEAPAAPAAMAPAADNVVPAVPAPTAPAN